MSVVGQVVLACVLFSVPGYALGLVAGLRGWAAVGAGPVLTLAVAVVCSAAVRTLGMSWGVGTALVSWLVLLAAALALASVPAALARRRAPDPEPDEPDEPAEPAEPAEPDEPAEPGARTVTDHVILGVGLLVVAFWGARTITRVTDGLTAVNQAWDSLFHAGAIRLIASTGDTAPSALSAIGQPNNPDFFYPNIYHVVAALHLQITGSGAAISENATAAALPFLFVVSVVGLLATLGARCAVVLFGAVLAVSLSAFPFTIIAYGALLPFAAAVAALPGMVALTEELVRRPRGSVAVLAGLGGVGLLFTHPSVAVVAVLWCGAHVVVAIAARGLLSRRLMAALVVLGSRGRRRIAAVGGGSCCRRARSPPRSTGRRSPTAPPAVGQMWFFATIIGKPQWVAGVVLLLGLLVVARTPVLWATFAVAAVMTALYVLAAAYQSGLTALWWDDPSRFGALFVPPAVVMAAYGAGALLEWITGPLVRLWRRRETVGTAWRLRLVAGAAAVAVVALFGAFTSGLYQERHTVSMAPSFADGPTLSEGEQAGLAFLRSQYEGGAVMNDPQDGSPYGYAIYELPMVFKAPVTLPITPGDIGRDRLLLLDEFNRMNSDPGVAKAVARLDVRWVVTGTGFLLPTQEREPGLTDLDRTPGLTKVFDNGDSQVYRVTPPAST